MTTFTPQLRPEGYRVEIAVHSTISQDFAQGTSAREGPNLGRPAKSETQFSLKTDLQQTSTANPQKGSNLALQDYEMQLMLLEQRNKKRLMMARKKQDALQPPQPRMSDNKTGYAGEQPTIETERKRAQEMMKSPDTSCLTEGEKNAPIPRGKRQKILHTGRSIHITGSKRKFQSNATLPTIQSLDPETPEKPPTFSLDTTKFSGTKRRRQRDNPKSNSNGPEVWQVGRELPYESYYRVVHRISCGDSYNSYSPEHDIWFFADTPFRANRNDGRDGYQHLSGNQPISNLGEWIFNAGNIAFVVFKEYRCRDSSHWDTRRRLGSLATITPVFKESIAIASDVLQSAVTEVSRCAPNDADYDDAAISRERPYISSQQERKEEIETYPHRFLYQHRDSLSKYAASSEGSARDQITALLSYIQASQGRSYEEADRLIAQGKIRRLDLEMLFCPNDIMIAKKPEFQVAYVLRAWPTGGSTISLDCWAWEFDGHRLHRKPTQLTIMRPPQEVISIRDLEVLPLRFATADEVNRLQTRGLKFWSLRYQSLVTYNGWDAKAEQFYSNEARCMIDYRTYRKFHPDAPSFAFSQKSMVPFDPWPETISHNTTLKETELILLPAEIHGFPLKEKKWFSFLVDNVGSVTWNKDAFDRLVLPSRTKDLVKALVMVRTSARGAKQEMSLARKRDDLIAGKGNGLVMLLHGGPGTGKTLTAESVAEIAEMPLYSVTCGDIGTNPVAVESYLETVFALGKMWNCVLLLDEADIFLEERSLSDLGRNSLVSVFLRSLEYYDGILILTSNRVGIFDEAFKSRIQVSLHYPTLDRLSRRKIWQNFFDMLQADEEDVDLGDLGNHMDELADEEMNGRQIRNVLATARQLALFRKETLDWGHVEQAIKPAGDFKRYLQTVHGHTDEQWARDRELR